MSGMGNEHNMKNITNKMIVLVVFVFASIAPSFSQTNDDDTPRSEVEIRGSYLDLTGDARFSTSAVPGTTISIEDDFNLPDRLGLDLRYTYRTGNGKHKFMVNYLRADFEATATLRRTIVFQGQVYPVNLEVEGNYQLDDFRVLYSYRWGSEKLRIGPMVDIGVVRSKVKVAGTINGIPVDREGETIKPSFTVGYDIDYDPTPRFNIFHRLGGIAAGGDRLFRTEVGIKFFPVRNFGITGGYSHNYYKSTEENDNFVAVRPQGPFFGGVIRF